VRSGAEVALALGSDLRLGLDEGEASARRPRTGPHSLAAAAPTP
jgi:hypothetical protein